MGQCEWLKPLELAAQIPWLFLSCTWVRMIVLISSPSNFLLSICPCRLLVKKRIPAFSRLAWGKRCFPTTCGCQLCAWCDSLTQVDWGNSGLLAVIRRHVCQADLLSLSRALLRVIRTKVCALCFRCDPNCRFWRFCRLQAPKVKPSRWRRWAQFVGTGTVPVPGCLGGGSLWERDGTGY